MTRRIPIFEFNEELSSKKPQVYKSLIEGVSEAIKSVLLAHSGKFEFCS